MNTAISTLSRLFSPRRRDDVDPDPADMGTCFGMEMTLQRDPPPLESEQKQAASTPEARPDAPASVSEKRGWRPWAPRSTAKAPITA